jgi:SAM-dependent methyltransferase
MTATTNSNDPDASPVSPGSTAEPRHVAFVPVRKRSPQHVVIKRMLATPAPERPAVRVLDLPAGHGSVSFPLAFAGFDVTAGDLFPERLQAMLDALRDPQTRAAARRNLPVPDALRPVPADGDPGARLCMAAARADMEAPLPFEDGAFDVVLSVEGIEHVAASFAFLRETRRVLKPGGVLLLTTPNTLCLRSRMAYAWTGNRTLRTMIDEYLSVEAQEAGRLYHGHVFIPDYFRLRYMMVHSGFRIRRLHASRFSPTSMLLWPLMAPGVGWFTFNAARRRARRFRRCADPQRVPPGSSPPYPQIMRHVLSPALLLSNALIVEARAA